MIAQSLELSATGLTIILPDWARTVLRYGFTGIAIIRVITLSDGQRYCATLLDILSKKIWTLILNSTLNFKEEKDGKHRCWQNPHQKFRTIYLRQRFERRAVLDRWAPRVLTFRLAYEICICIAITDRLGPIHVNIYPEVFPLIKLDCDFVVIWINLCNVSFSCRTWLDWFCRSKKEFGEFFAYICGDILSLPV